MISGAVDLLRKPVVTLTVFDINGQERSVQANVDTGFSDSLTLPSSAIEQLGLKLLDRSNFRIGNGALATFNTYAATIRWHSGIRQITVLESEIFPVMGVGLLWENRLSVDFVLGGAVTVAELPELDGGV